MFDVLILMHEKDFLKFRFVYESLLINLEGVDKVHCISNVKIPKKQVITGVEYYLDDAILDFDFSRFEGVVKVRKGWYRQQFIKLFQQVTSDDYLVVDSDVYFNKKINIIENGKPSFLFGNDQHHLPYFRFMETVFNLDKVYPYSFINEMMFFKREIIKHMISSTGFNIYGFFELVIKVLNEINEESGFSEYELYGNYVTKYFKDSYNYKYLKVKRYSKHRIWEEDEIQKYINSVKESNYDLITYHSWR